MAEIETKDLVSFDELLTPRIVPFLFWMLEVVNVVFWIGTLVPRATSEAGAVLDPNTGQFADGGTDYNWGTIVFCFVMMLVGAVLIRVACDLLLCIFRWQASTRGILMAMTGAPTPMALAQGGSGVPGATAAPARIAAPGALVTTVSTQPPWEQAAPAQAAPTPAPPAQTAPAAAQPRAPQPQAPQPRAPAQPPSPPFPQA